MDDVWRKIYFLLQTLILLGLTTLPLTESDVLYTGDDCVTLLNENNFESTIYGKDNIWFVEFYNSWCGTCIRFAPTWKQLGEDVRGWRSVVRIAALDCSVEDHVKICNQHIGNRGYPTLVLFPTHYTSNSINNQPVFFEGAMEMKDLKNNLLSYIQKQLSYLKPEVTSSFMPLSSVDDVWKSATVDTIHAVVLFENQSSPLCLQVVLAAMEHKQLLVRCIVTSEASKYHISVFPSMYLVNRSMVMNKLACGSDASMYRRALLGLVVEKEQDVGEYEGAGDHPVEGEGQAGHTHTGTVVIHMLDLESTLHYSLKQEVAGCGEIEGENLEALRNYVHVLAKYFPGRGAIVDYLWAVYDWLKTQKNSMTGTDWLASIEKLQTPSLYLPSTVEWACCEGSSKQYRGYPCGLWTLFHTLTVSAVARHNKMPDFKSQEVLLAMKGYITNFFGCRECATNFQQEVKDMSTVVQQPNDAILYLWRVHNSVNQRLHGDLTEDPEHPKVQFPTQELCTSCRISEPQNPSSSIWDEGEVLNFLKQVYLQNIVNDTYVQGPAKSSNGAWESRLLVKNPRDPKMRRDFEEFYKQRKEKREDYRGQDVARNLELSYDMQKELLRSKFMNIEQEAYNESKKIHSVWNFSNFDISMCVLFYLICTIIIIGVYFNLMIRRRSLVKKQSRGWLQT